MIRKNIIFMEANTTQEASSISPPADAKSLEQLANDGSSTPEVEDNPYLSKS